MIKLSNEELKQILTKRIEKIKNSNLVVEKTINEESVKTLAKHLSLGNEITPLAFEFFQIAPKMKIVWLHLCECTGCSESLLRSELPNFDEFVFDFFSLEYHETLMAANGTKAEELLEEVLKDEFVLAVEGGVAAIDTFFLTIGAKGESGFEILNKLATKAKAIFAMGTCSSYGGIQAAYPNPSKTCGISEVLSQKVVNIPGCPPSDVNIIASLAFFALFDTLPELDTQNRPVWAYGKCLHDLCERKAKFESGIFADTFDDEKAKNGACLFKIGCKGPYTYNNCPKVKFNSKTSWPVASGHGCIACSEKNFWDEFGNYEKAMTNEFFNPLFATNSANEIFNDNCDKTYTNTLTRSNILLNLCDKSAIKLLDEQSEIDYLDFSFESNPKVFLSSFTKTKIATALVENYKKEFANYYDFIQENYNNESVISHNILDLFYFVYPFITGKKLNNIDDFLQLYLEYNFKHPSKFDFKINYFENVAKLDVSKSLRMPLIYMLGGLDKQGIAFGLIYSLKEYLRQILKTCKEKYNKKDINIVSNCSSLRKVFLDLNEI